MLRRRLLTTVISLAAIVLTLLTQETLAYYSVFGEATNAVTSGEISVRVVEKLGANELSDKGVYIMPGRTVEKRIAVLNNGENPCWVRVKLKNGIDSEALSPDIAELDINTESWLDGGDGYYYYRIILAPNTESAPLFTQIKIAGSADNSYLGKTLKLTVTAFAVQSEYNDRVASPLEVAGWPAES